MNKKRLLKLAAFLKTLPTEKFDMREWVITDTCNLNEIFSNDCRTACCAFGWATTIPEFRKHGLKLRDNFSIITNDISRKYRYYVGVRYKNFDGFEAAKSFFNLDLEDCYWLFDSSEYPSDRLTQPKYVAKRIEAFVRKKERANKKMG